ncbi:copper resistance protein NlpE [Prevotellamassilia timonensis]|uniref:copper resistance protein NlpE n=1 Tax=Prevotellamassilia timonensis TaxID=1852370 RepID=UPI0030775706
MKKNLVIAAAAAAALCMASCHGNTKSNDTGKDSLSTVASDSLNAGVAIESLAGTYEGTLPAADCPGIRTVLTLNADSTYQYSADYLERKDGHDEASGVFKVLANNVVEIIRPSSGEATYYKVKDANSIIMTDSLGNEPEGETAKLYVLTKKK